MDTSCEIALKWMAQNTFDDEPMLFQVFHRRYFQMNFYEWKVLNFD